MYTELQVTTNYSFLRGASHIEELFARAAVLRLPALGITDRNSLAGIVRAHQRAQEAGMRLIVGCRLDLTDGPSVLVYPTDRAAYARLTPAADHGEAARGQRQMRARLDRSGRRGRGPDRASFAADPTARKHRPPESRLCRSRLCGADADAPPQRRGAAANDCRHRAAPRTCPSSPPTTCCITRPAVASCRMC